MRGGPTKLTPEIHQRIVQCVRSGNYFEVAAAYAGVAKSTFYEWLRKGRTQKSGPYKNLVDEVQLALAKSEAEDVALIAQAGKEDWKAAAWRLERKYRDRWGRYSAVQISDAASLMDSNEVNLDELSTEELEALERILNKKNKVTAKIVKEEGEDGGQRH